MDEYLSKPIQTDQLLAALKRLTQPQSNQEKQAQ
jgi:YesN/AraC family two-component response regulator